MSTVRYPHIEVDPDGVATVSGTMIKVVELVQDHLAHHWHAEDIQRQLPHLSLAQVHAALTYYYDHQQEMDEEIERRLERVAKSSRRSRDDTHSERTDDPLDAEYARMAADEARETEALYWAEATIGDVEP